MSADHASGSAGVRRGTDVPLEDLTAAVNKAFADYIVPIEIDANYLQSQVDLAGSYVACDDAGVIQAFCFLDSHFGPKSGRTRIGLYGAVPEARGTGVAKQLLKRVIDDVRASGAPHIELECFAQNERAIRYRLL